MNDTVLAPSTPRAAPTAGLTPSLRQLLSFAVGQEGYAIPIDAVRELVEVPAMTALPLLPDFMRGVMNLRGAVVPIVDLAARLGRPPVTLSKRSCVVIVDATDQAGQTQRVGMLVDAVHEVLDVSDRDLELAPALGTRAPAEFLEHVARVRGSLLEVLSLARVLDLDRLAEQIGLHTGCHDPAGQALS